MDRNNGTIKNFSSSHFSGKHNFKLFTAAAKTLYCPRVAFFKKVWNFLIKPALVIFYLYILNTRSVKLFKIIQTQQFITLFKQIVERSTRRRNVQDEFANQNKNDTTGQNDLE